MLEYETGHEMSNFTMNCPDRQYKTANSVTVHYLLKDVCQVVNYTVSPSASLVLVRWLLRKLTIPITARILSD